MVKSEVTKINKKGNIILYVIFSFIALILFFLLAMIIPDTYDDLRVEKLYSSSSSFIATTTNNETLSYIGEGIKTITVTRQNSTWLDFDGVDDYLFIPQYDYYSVSFWVKGSTGDWLHVVNSSDGLIYEDNATVVSWTLNAFKRNSTGWYFGINSSGYFNGSIDTIKFYNDTMNESQVSIIFADGR